MIQVFTNRHARLCNTCACPFGGFALMVACPCLCGQHACTHHTPQAQQHCSAPRCWCYWLSQQWWGQGCRQGGAWPSSTSLTTPATSHWVRAHPECPLVLAMVGPHKHKPLWLWARACGGMGHWGAAWWVGGKVGAQRSFGPAPVVLCPVTRLGTHPYGLPVVGRQQAEVGEATQ